MELTIKKNILLKNADNKNFLADAYYVKSQKKLPLVIFVHGYKGYKDWGAWDLMAQEFAKAGFFFVKFNFSHNGTTTESPENFNDLEAFGNNNYSKELSDLGIVIDYFSENDLVDVNHINLIGHSRGGGISIIKTNEDKRIKTLTTLASVDTLNRFPKAEAFKNWQDTGVYYVLNGRTKQQMPHYFQFFKDYENNKERYDITKAMKSIKAKVLIIHGTNDEAVSIKSAENLHLWNTHSQLFIIEKANHTFGAKEPWDSITLPKDLSDATQKCIAFIQDALL